MCRPQRGWLHVLTGSTSNQHTAILSSKRKHLLSENPTDLTPFQWAPAWYYWCLNGSGLEKMGIHGTGRLAWSCPWSNRFETGRCVTVVSTAFRVSVVFSLIMQRHPLECILLEVPFLDHCCHQSYTVNIFLLTLSAILRKQNIFIRSRTTRPRSNSLTLYNGCILRLL